MAIAKGLKGGGNMAAVHLANAVGGNVFLGFISAVAFATILAVVAGLTLSGRLGRVARPVRHGVKKGKADSASELRVSKITTVCLGIFAVCWASCSRSRTSPSWCAGLRHRGSANFPVLFMSVLWKDCTTKGAVIGGFLGLISSVALTVVSPSVWEATLGNPKGSALFPYTSPALFSMTIGLRGHLAVLHPRPQRPGRQGTRRLPGAAGPLGNRPWEGPAPGRVRAGGECARSRPTPPARAAPGVRGARWS
jgi:cation/acetate symporter